MILDKINLLNPMQKEAVLKTEGPLLLLAGAGSGKTRVITHRIAYIIEKGVSPFNILAITFTNKAAREMRERVIDITPFGREVWISTFHSTCVKILRRDIHNLGYSNSFTIYDTEDSERLLKDIYKNNNISEKLIPYKYAINEISRQKDKLISAEQYEEENFSNFKKQDYILIYKEYEKMLKLNNALDFDDLIFKTIELFTKYPEILEKYQDRFHYIMVDEYQDTSTSQYKLVKILASKYKNLCVVGDDDQSIYSWRGADVENILNFEKDFNAETIRLEQNYRSTKIILDAANSVIQNNFKRKHKFLWTENQPGELIKFNRCNSDREEALFVANEIKNKIRDGFKYSDFAILYRNNFLSRVIEEQLVILGIPYKIYGGLNFYSRKEIKDILAYLKILNNRNDDISLKRIINIPKRGIGNTTVDKLSVWSLENECSVFHLIEHIDEIEEFKSKAKSLLKFYETIQDFAKYSEENKVSDLINYILEKTGYLKELEEIGKEGISKIENIEELINKAIEFENNEEDVSLQMFLEEVALVSNLDNSEEEVENVTLMTLHSSKGLEFNTVFIIGFEEGLFPVYGALISTDSNEKEEERRLCYVGITRAKKELFITCAKERFRNGNFVRNLESSFLEEIPTELIKDISKKPTINSTKVSSSYRPKVEYKSSFNTNINRNILTPKDFKIDFTEGDIISHFKFGKGVVQKIAPAGADYEITVDFENTGVKKLMAKLSRLKKI